MDMSETWHPTNGNEGTAPISPDAAAGAPDPAGSAEATGPAIPLPPANSGQGALYPVPQGPGALPPTAPNPSITAGSPTPPTGVWTPPPGTGWHPGGAPVDPYAGAYAGAAGGPPPAGGWPPPGYPYPPAYTPAPAPKRRGLVAGLAAVVLLVAIVGGIGLGHVVWPVQGSTTSATSASGSSGSSGSTGSSGGTTSPFGGGSSSGSSPFGSGSSGSSSSGSGNTSTGAGAPSDISSIASKVDPGLVDINTNLSYEDEQAAGTGMVLTSNGEILTNNHVIDGATSISVTDVGNGKTYTGKVVGYDRTGDVAVVQLTGASGLKTVSIGGKAAVGEAVVGIGNAGGTGGTPSDAGGSVVALDQSITASDDSGGNSENLSGLIEINAGIEPGDSGGSLVDSSGQVIGMDTAASTGSSYEDSGTQAYAIPVSTALSIAKQIEAGNASTTVHIGATGFLGVSVEDASSTGGSSANGGLGGAFGGSFGSGSSSSGTAANGATVEGTLSGSPAAKAGLVQGDVITAVDGKSVNSATDLSNLLEPEHPGNVVQLQWTDGSGQTQTASVTLESGPPA